MRGARGAQIGPQCIDGLHVTSRGGINNNKPALGRQGLAVDVQGCVVSLLFCRFTQSESNIEMERLLIQCKTIYWKKKRKRIVDSHGTGFCRGVRENMDLGNCLSPFLPLLLVLFLPNLHSTL